MGKPRVPEERGSMVKVLVGKRQGPSFPGFWAEFEGEEVASYEDTRGGKSIVYTLYRCTAYDYDAYRVHVADESNPANPVYDLLPGREGSGGAEPGRGFPEPWQKEQVVAQHPMFVKDLDYLEVEPVDPPTGGS
jgi:hypothetical protein